MRAKILVVDDEADMVELLRFNLQQRGYEVVVARSGVEALHKARTAFPDLVLLDLMLDGLDGFTVCEILRRQPSTSAIPVIILTALGGEMARLNGLGAGADEFLNKPFQVEDLLSRVKKHVELHHARVQESLADTPDEECQAVMRRQRL